MLENTKHSLASQYLAEVVKLSLDEKKAHDVVIIDLTGKSDVADFMVIASGTSSTHVGALASHVVERMKQTGMHGVTVEGMEQGDWVLVDNPHVIVHVFRPEIREYYNLEKMWGIRLPELEAVEHVY